MKQPNKGGRVSSRAENGAAVEDNRPPASAFWFGDLPKGWETRRIGSLFSERSVKVSDKEYAPLSVTREGILPQLEHAAKSNDGDNRKLVRIGDFVINSRSDRKGSCGVSSLDGSVSLISIVLEPRYKIDRNYAHHLLRSQPFSEEFYHNGRGIVGDLWTTRYSEMKTILLPLPPIPVQRRIVAFLDEKTAAMERLVTIWKKEISELEELKKAIIHRAVTRGIRETGGRVSSRAENGAAAVDSRPPSSTSWFGELPQGWAIKRLRHLVNCQNGLSKGGQYFGHGSPFVSYKDVYDNPVLPETPAGLVDSIPEEQSRYSVQYGDIFFTRTSETIDEVGIASVCLKTIPKATFAGFVIRCRPRTKDLMPEFSKYCFRNLYVNQYFAGQMTIVTRASLSQGVLKQLPVIIPPLPVQREIVAYLDEKCAAIDGAIANKRKSIEELTALKSRIIADAVTGRMEVK